MITKAYGVITKALARSRLNERTNFRPYPQDGEGESVRRIEFPSSIPPEHLDRFLAELNRLGFDATRYTVTAGWGFLVFERERGSQTMIDLEENTSG